jgi:hypothetical protein
MYDLPDGMLTYIFVDQSILHSILVGLFVLPFWFLALFALFRFWQDELWEEYNDFISVVLDAGFVCPSRSIWPRWCFYKEDLEIRLVGSPFGVWGRLVGHEGRRLSTSTSDLIALIDSLAPGESTSTPQSC